jgi:hypothetical protein
MSAPSTFQGELIKQTGPGVQAITAQLTDAAGNQYILAAPTAEGLKRALAKHFPETPIYESKFVPVYLILKP